jgi:hypothetical protein
MHTKATSQVIGPVYNLVMSKTATGRDLLKFTIKTWRASRNGHDKVCWWNVIAYEGNARCIHQYVKENGRMIVIDGHMDLFAVDSESPLTFQIIVEKFYFIHNGEIISDAG